MRFVLVRRLAARRSVGEDDIVIVGGPNMEVPNSDPVGAVSDINGPATVVLRYAGFTGRHWAYEEAA